MANSVDLDETALLGAASSEFALFAKNYRSQCLEILRNSKIHVYPSIM